MLPIFSQKETTKHIDKTNYILDEAIIMLINAVYYDQPQIFAQSRDLITNIIDYKKELLKHKESLEG